ncbi:MAG: Na(+)-translocating NADH-quinone reductase subunit C [Pseudomonadota bacterium]
MPDKNPLQSFLERSNEDPVKIVGVAVALCLICSILVSAAAIGLRPQQAANKLAEKQRNILQVAGLLMEDADVDQLFQDKITARAIDLETGDFTDAIDAVTYDAVAAARDPEQSLAVAPEDDIASIKRKAKYATVYLVEGEDEGSVATVIIPVHGYGLWSTLYGFLALKPDGDEIVGLQFYEHAETPGLGGEIDNPNWRAQWNGKELFGEGGDVEIEIVKSGASGAHQIDGLAGATLTSNGVHNLVRYWAGENGFGPFLEKLPEELSKNG